MSPSLPTVVVVDDAPEVRMLVKARLRLSGHFEVVGEGSTGLDAVELARTLRPEVIILDVSMPDMDGLQAIPGVLELSPGTCIVLYSGFDEQGLVAHARELGAAGFIEKSSEIDRLAEQILAVMASHSNPAGADGSNDVVAVIGSPPSEGEESVLLEHLERFREVFQEAAIGMATLTLTGQVVRANRALEEMFRTHPESFVGAPYAQHAATAADGIRLTEAIRDLAAGKAPVLQVEHAVTTPDGELRVRTTLAAVRGAQGQPLYLFLQAQDITEQRQAAEALRRSEERFRLLVDAVEDYAIFMLDTRGRVASWNAGAQRIKGYSEEEVIGRHFRLFYPEELKASGHPEFELEEALREGRYEEEGRRIRKDGTEFWANVVLTSIRNADGEHLGYAKVTRDITQQREGRERLRQSEERFRLLVDAVEDYAIFLLDPQGLISSWNAGAQRIKGYREEEVLGKHFRMFYPEDKQREKHPEHELEIAVEVGRYEEEGWRVRSDRTTFWANVLITTIRNDQGEHLGFAKVTRDITSRQRILEERTRAADALAVANDELEAMNVRLARAAADQSQFLAVTAHELRGPVGVLGGSADTLAAHWADLTEVERAEMFAGMATSAGRLRRLLGDLLTATRLEAGVIEFALRPVAVGELLQAAAGAVARAYPEMVVDIDCPDGLEVTADFDRAAQAMENMLVNAVIHGRAPLHIKVVPSAATIDIRISDSGPGVPLSVQPRLFERFATGDTRGGTGLGLYIVRALMHAQGGEAGYDPGNDNGDHAFVLTFSVA